MAPFLVTVECCKKCGRVPFSAQQRAKCKCGHVPVVPLAGPAGPVDISREAFGRVTWGFHRAGPAAMLAALDAAEEAL